MITDWRYYYRCYLGWVPVQFCMVCGRPYWGGLPKPEWLFGQYQWMPWWKDYCSQKCCDEDPFV